MSPLFKSPTDRQVSVALTVLRVILGITFIMHGGQKLFVYGLEGVSGSFAGMGIPMPGVTGPLVAMIEFFGGVALVVGLLTRLAAVGTAAIMAGAILTAHIEAGFFAPAGYEFPLMLLATSIALAVAGAGPLSLDAVIGARAAKK
jgi:putative oxidoreductase